MGQFEFSQTAYENISWYYNFGRLTIPNKVEHMQYAVDIGISPPGEHTLIPKSNLKIVH